MFRVFFRAKEVAHLTYNEGFSGEQEFSIPEKSKLVLTKDQQERLEIRVSTAIGTFAPETENQDIARKIFRMKGDKDSVRELYSILRKSGLTVTYTANGSHQVVVNDRSLINLIDEEKVRVDQMQQKHNSR